MARAIMMQGTASNVGKSILAAAFCRIYRRRGVRVAPFKAQNMALNSYVTSDGLELGHAQAVQAWAAGLEPRVEMNPVLLKPSGNSRSQVVVMGRPVSEMDAMDYHGGKNLALWPVIQGALAKLQEEFELLVIEGAGSPAEVNLRDRDLANMRTAMEAAAPVLLVADIDRGGALAAVVGTMELLEPGERELVAGIILNKFRGDMRILVPALDFLEGRTGKPVLGVVPHLPRLGVAAEDSVALEGERVAGGGALKVAVALLPRISNFTDFDALEAEPDVNLCYAPGPGDLKGADLIVLPGSKNTVEDLAHMWRTGLAREVQRLAGEGVPVIGVCGGYQMLGELVEDGGAESALAAAPGLGLLPVKTTFRHDKVTRQVYGRVIAGGPLLENLKGVEVKGYEIHMGQSTPALSPALRLAGCGHGDDERFDGAVSASGLVLGTYLHGLFDNDVFRRGVLDALRIRKGLDPLEAGGLQGEKARREAAFDRLADTVEAALDWPRLEAALESVRGGF